MTSLAKALVVCLVLAAACAAEDFIKHDFVVPKDGSVYSEPRIVHGHSVKDPNPYPWVVLVSASSPVFESTKFFQNCFFQNIEM